VHALGELADGLARCDAAHDLELALRQPIVRRALIAAGRRREPLGHGLADVAPAAHDPLERGDQLLGRRDLVR